jgi:anti-sigma factor RsiW
MQLLLDGRIDAAQRNALDRHLTSCSTCVATLEEYRHLSSATAEWARPKADEDPGAVFNDRLMRALEAQHAAVRKPDGGNPALAIFVASIAAIGAGAWIAKTTDLLTTLPAALPHGDWPNGLNQLPVSLQEIWQSAWRSLDAILASTSAISVPTWAVDLGAAAILVNLFFFLQTLSNRRRQSA